MKIIKFKAENIKKLKAVEITPDGNIVKITGKNEQGKTTVLDAIWWALGGTKDIQDQPLRAGQSEGKIELNLGELTVTRTFSAKNGGTLVIKREGSRAPLNGPQGILDDLMGKFTFDPMAFYKADRKKQVEILLGIVDLKPDVEKLEKLAGYKPRKTDPIELINEVYEYIFNERTVVNRDLEKTKAKLESLPKGVTETKPVVTVELIAEKEKLEKINQGYEERRTALNKEKEAIDSLKTEIATLENQLTEKKKQLSIQEKTFGLLSDEVSLLIDMDLTEIKEKIATADETNTKAKQWEDQEKVMVDLIEYQQESDHLTGKLEEIKKYKAELINKAKFPVPGLDFGNGGVMYQGLPLEQASGTARLKVSMAIGMALNPKLRIIQIDEANSIDSEHMKVIEQMAAENDFQIWMTLTDESGQVGVYIEDGEIKNG